jgi:hypothetical protein
MNSPTPHPFIKWFAEIRIEDVPLVGGKNASLGENVVQGSVTPGKPKVVLTHGEARGREPLAALIQRRHRIKASLPVQGDVIEL